jgi:hypothetical protein
LRHIAFVLLLLVGAPPFAAARPAVEEAGVFSVEIPDDWAYDEKNQVWGSPDRSCALALASVPDVKDNLQTWASKIVQKHPSAASKDDTLGALPAARLEFVSGKGNQTFLWVSIRGKQGAVISLVHAPATKVDIAAVVSQVQSSYKWLGSEAK